MMKRNGMMRRMNNVQIWDMFLLHPEENYDKKIIQSDVED